MPKAKDRVTIRQVAQVCHVSAMTVSAVLNGTPGQVSPETRDRVLQAVRETGYRLTPAHREPEAHPTAILGVIAGVPGHSLMQPGYYNSILDGVLTAADGLSHHVLLLTSRSFFTDIGRSIRIYCDGRCDGLLVIAPPRASGLVVALQERGLPFVLIGDTGEDSSIPCADVNNEAEAQRVVEYLIDRGHRRIAFFGKPDRYPGDPEAPRSAYQREQGYEKALASRDIRSDPAMKASVGGDDSLAYQQAIQLLGRPPTERPTAIFCWHDAASPPVLNAIQELGLRCPHDVSVVGFDDDPSIAGTQPGLTTIRQPYAAICAAGINILAGLIQKRQDFAPQRLLPAELVVRDSVAPPPLL